MFNPFKRKNKTQLTYEEEHNRAFWKFQKSSQILIWAGVLNVMGLIVTTIQANTAKDPNMASLSFFLCFSINDLIFRLLMVSGILKSIPWMFYIIAFIISIATSAGFILLGVLGSQGRRKPLFAGVILYFIDMLVIIPLAILGEDSLSLWLIAGIHAIIMVFASIAVYEYFNIIKIAIKHNVIKEAKPETIKIIGEEKENGNDKK